RLNALIGMMVKFLISLQDVKGSKLISNKCSPSTDDLEQRKPHLFNGVTKIRNRGTGRSSTELKMGQMGQGEGCLLDQKKLPGGYVASNGYGSLDDLMNGMMKRV
ncbi:hypothetical protein Tco_1453862, partial [Tanacetum coccineum]